MRPDILQTQLLDALNSAGIKARPADGREGSGMNYGVIVTAPSGGEYGWQIAGRLAPGDRHDQPAPQPVTGEPPTPVAMPLLTGGVVKAADVETALASTVTRMSGCDQVASLDRYSTRARPPAIGYGIRVEFYDQSAAFIQLRSGGRA